jgi:hypothetical protein
MPTHQIAVDQEKLYHSRPSANKVYLPPKSEAKLLLEHYLGYIGPLQHVLHVPTIQATMELIYSSLDHALPIIPSEVALLLAIFASASALCTYFLPDRRK